MGQSGPQLWSLLMFKPLPFVVAALALVAASAVAQQPAPTAMTLTDAYAIRTIVGPNLGRRQVEGDFLRLGVFVNHTEEPTTAEAIGVASRIPLALYRGPILDDLYQAAVEYDPTLAGPWEFVVTRGTATERTIAP